jgi:hypothetical protein
LADRFGLPIWLYPLDLDDAGSLVAVLGFDAADCIEVAVECAVGRIHGAAEALELSTALPSNVR